MWNKLFFLICISIQLSSCATKNSLMDSTEDVTISVSSEEEVIEFVYGFYKYLSEDTVYDRFLIPEIKSGNYYFLDIQDYLDELTSSGWFSNKYVRADSNLVSPCIKEFNNKLYTIDLEGSFFDECASCNKLFINRLTGLDVKVSTFKHKIVMKHKNKFVVIGYCEDIYGNQSNEIKVICIVEEISGKPKIEEIVIG